MMCRRWWQLLLVLWVALASLPVRAAVETVADTLTNPDGTTPNGALVITWIPFTTAGGTRIAGGQKRVEFTSGAISVALEANDVAGVDPEDHSYEVKYTLENSVSWTEYWQIPPSGPHTIADVAKTPKPTVLFEIKLSQIEDGGANTGDALKFDGTNWAPGVVAGGIDCESPTTLTISGGAITVTGSKCFLVDTEGMVASDDLTSISCSAGQRFVLSPADGSRSVVIKQSLGLRADFTLDNVNDQFFMLCKSANTPVEWFRSDGGI